MAIINEEIMVSPGKSSMNRRALTSMFMFFSFLFLPLSGIPLHYAREGRFPNLEHWLMSVHNMAATIFVLATILHLIMNWKVLSRYMVEKKAEFFTFKREMIIALVVVIVLVGLFSSHAFHVHRP